MLLKNEPDMDFDLLLTDLDSFHTYNERYGERAGDLVLQAIGQSLLQISGPRTVVGRLGGDEFAVLMPHLEDL